MKAIQLAGIGFLGLIVGLMTPVTVTAATGSATLTVPAEYPNNSSSPECCDLGRHRFGLARDLP